MDGSWSPSQRNFFSNCVSVSVHFGRIHTLPNCTNTNQICQTISVNFQGNTTFLLGPYESTKVCHIRIAGTLKSFEQKHTFIKNVASNFIIGRLLRVETNFIKLN